MLRPIKHFREYWNGRSFYINPYTVNKSAQALARMYAKGVGFPPIIETPVVDVNPSISRTIAAIYNKAKSFPRDPKVRKCYNHLIQEVAFQYKILPVAITPYGDGKAPYESSKDMMDDLLKNRHLYVYTGGEDHPIFTRKENFKFRAVHDYFGHAAGGFTFGPQGEENAWIAHSKLFSPLARMALSTETRGQNSWVNFGPYSKLPPDKRPYAKQKVFILPRPLRIHPVFEEAYWDYPAFVGP
jgi:hypothetical protein